MPRLLMAMLLAFPGLVLADLGKPQQEPTVIGQAFDESGAGLLYSEYHYCNEERLHCRVFYLDPAGEIFANKDIDYRGSERSPQLYIRDFRTEMEFSVEPGDDPELVVDAGFDNYVRQRWEELLVGQSIEFPFLVAGRDEALPMKAGPGREAECDPRQMCLQIEVDSWLLGMLVDPIELTYDRGSQRLLRFRGVSNLKDGEGKSQVVDIRYRYPQQWGER